jgi:hypothetical protein
MGVERDGAAEPDNGPSTGQPQADRSPPPDRPGELEAPSRAESRRVVMEADQKEPEAGTDTTDDSRPKNTPTTALESAEQPESAAEGRAEQAPPENGETGTAPPNSTEQRRTDREMDSSSDSLERHPSYGNFANLAEEFDARAQSREQVEELKPGPEKGRPDDKSQSLDFKVDDESAREHIDPEADDADAAGGVETELEPAGDRAATAIEEGENDHRSKLERLRGVGYKNAEDALDKTQSGINKAADLFERPPTGSHAVVKTDQPAVAAPHHGMDAGETTTAVLATGIVIGELIRRGRNRLAERGDK